MSIFKKRQQVKKKRHWLKQLMRIERAVISIVILIVGLFSLYGIYYLIVFGSSFTLTDIIVKGDFKYTTSKALLQHVSARKGDNLFWISMENVHEQLNLNKWIKNVSVRRHLPHALLIYADEYNPKAIVLNTSMQFIDDNGQLFKSLDSGDNVSFPIFTGIMGLEESKRKQVLAHMLDLLEIYNKSIFGSDYPLAEIHYDAIKGYSVITDKEPIQILLGQGAYRAKFAKIDRLKKRINKQRGKIQYILANDLARLIIKYKRFNA